MSISLFNSRLVSKLPEGLTQSVGRATLIVQKNSPTILFGVGVVGLGATVYFASKGTLKASEVVEKYKSQNNDIEEVYSGKYAKAGVEYTERDYRLDKIVNLRNLCFSMAKVYWPAVLAGACTLGAFAGAHVILNKRNAGLAAAYAVLEKSFEAYRDNVIATYGEERDEEFRYNMVKRVEKDSEGKKTKTTVVDGNRAPSMYSRFFDEFNPNWTNDPALNRAFLSNVQNMMNDRLTIRGHVFLNEVYDVLGYERTGYGAVTGWVRSNDGTDNFVDFGIFGDDTDISHRMFVNGDEASVLLDFNVNGTIWDKIEGARR